MPFKSQQQRKLGYAAAATPGGIGGMPQAVGKEFVAADKPGKLPQTVAKPKPPKARAAPPSRFPSMSPSDKATANEVTRRVAARSK